MNYLVRINRISSQRKSLQIDTIKVCGRLKVVFFYSKHAELISKRWQRLGIGGDIGWRNQALPHVFQFLFYFSDFSDILQCHGSFIFRHVTQFSWGQCYRARWVDIFVDVKNGVRRLRLSTSIQFASLNWLFLFLIFFWGRRGVGINRDWSDGSTNNLKGITLTMRPVYMGYWPSVRSRWLDIGQVLLFGCLRTSTSSRSVHKLARKERGQYPVILTEQTWLIKDLLYGFRGNFSCGIQPGSPERARWLHLAR